MQQKSAVILPFEVPAQLCHRAIKVHGVAEVGYYHDDRTRLKHLYQTDPLRVLFPRSASAELPIAVISSTSGGLVGGDRLDMRIELHKGARALATMQAAEKVYRSSGPDSYIEVGLKIAENCWLEWLPQETILFEGARLKRCTRVELAADSKLLAGEMLVLGRLAGGEQFSQGLLRDAWEVRIDGRLIWADVLKLDRDIAATIASPAGFNDMRACATAIYVGSDAAQQLDVARELMQAPADVRCGVTCLGQVLVCRWLARDPLKLRQSYGRFWAAFRNRAAGLPEQLPRLWHI
jgi:urease accessory protein